MTPAGVGAAPAECVVNISEGRDPDVVAAVAAAAGGLLLDVHTDAEHHRSVLTLAGPLVDVEAATRDLATAAVRRIDLSRHSGVHPRLGAVDVVPFVPLRDHRGAATRWESVRSARDAYRPLVGRVPRGSPASSTGRSGACPRCGAAPSRALAPDVGPATPHPTAGATAVGARGVLIAYNVWITAARPGGRPTGEVVAAARAIAADLRRPGLRTLGLAVGDGAQVSCNVVDPGRVPLDAVYDEVDRGCASHGCTVVRGELVGLLPDAALGTRARGPKGPSSACVPRTPSNSAWDPVGTDRRRSGPGYPSAYDAAAARRCIARCRRNRRRSRSDSPPQMPNFSPFASAYSRQSSRTTHPRHTSFASRVDAPRSGKKRSGSTPMQFALVCHVRSWGPYINDTMSIARPPSHSSMRLRVKPHSTDVTTGM